MLVIFLDRKHMRWGILLVMTAIFTAGVFVNWDRIARQVLGVKPGVRLEGYQVGGLLPEEVGQLVRGMAAKINRSPRNASYFPETGEIIPAEAGREVNIVQNVNQVCGAKAHSSLKLLVQNLNPAVPEDFFKPVYHGKKDLPNVALAINVAWGEELLSEILSTLEKEKVKATFFMVGTWVKDFPELTRQIAVAGHEIANHGLYHGHPLQMGREELKRLITENELLISKVTGKKSANFFAPPYGELNSLIVSVAGELGYRTIMWSVDSVDWKNPSPDVLRDRVLSKIEAGGIILLHPTESTKQALPTLIQSLRKRGLKPGTVSMVL